jgi:Ca2+-binding RTX toxin-like protein
MTKVRATAADDDGLHHNAPIEVGIIATYDVTGAQTDTSFQLSPPTDHDAAQIWTGVGLGAYVDGLPTIGTITGLTVINGGTLQVEEIWSNFSISAASFQHWVVNNEDALAQKAFFGGNDQFIGGGVTDYILGFAGNDAIRGEGAGDILNGGAGRDALTGGSGADTFVFDARVISGNRDTISDFSHGQHDEIQLQNSVFAGLGAAVQNLAPAKFFAGASAHDANDRVIYDSATGKLFYDRDGTGAHAQVLIATLTNHATLVSGDFQVI